MKKIISILLTILLVFQLIPAVAFASDGHFKYVAIGDSVGSGFGLKGYTPVLPDIPLLGVSLQSWHGADFDWNIRNTNVATYPKYVADSLLSAKTNGEIKEFPALYSQNEKGEYVANFKIDNKKTLEENRDEFFAQYPVTYANLGCPGFLLKDYYLMLLNDSFSDQSKYDPEHICSFWATSESMWPLLGGKEKLMWCPTMREEIEDADLSTLNIGANDLLFSFRDELAAKKDNKLLATIFYIIVGGMLEMYDGIHSTSEFIEKIRLKPLIGLSLLNFG